MKNAPHILILAAGQGKRMKSKLPKVLHQVLHRPMIHHVLDLAYSLPHSKVTVILGHGEKEVREACSAYKNLIFVRQEKQLGTGDAVRSAEKVLGKEKGSVLVLSGDVILLRKEPMTEFINEHYRSKAACTFMTANLPDPAGYGRILRGLEGQILGIKEQADASEEEKRIAEINSGIYCFDIPLLFKSLKTVQSQNKQKEFYLTDVVEKLVDEEQTVIGELIKDWHDIMGINDRAQLAFAEHILQKRVNHRFMLDGVTIQSPDTVTIDPRCEIEPDVIIEKNCTVIDSKIRSGAHIKQGSYIAQSEVGEATTVGPYAHLRPGSVLKSKVKIGNFVEVKKATFESGAKASHLSYIGDAKIGKEVNLGCGFITCNYDGKNKSETIIEDGVFVGSDSQIVAPVKIGKNSYVASGSTVTENVPSDSLVISRGKQITKKGYAKRYGLPFSSNKPKR